MVSYTLKKGTKPTTEQLREIKEAAKYPIVYDKDSPKLTSEQYDEFAEIAQKQREGRSRKVVALHLLPSTVAKAKKLGKGYTSILSRMIELCIDDAELVKKCL